MKVRLMKLDSVNRNHSFISSFEVEKYLVLRYNEEPICCHIDPISSDGLINLEMVSHILTDLRMDNGYLVGDIRITDTSEGEKLGHMIQDNYSFAASYHSIVRVVDKIQYPYNIHNVKCFPTDKPAFD